MVVEECGAGTVRASPGSCSGGGNDVSWATCCFAGRETSFSSIALGEVAWSWNLDSEFEGVVDPVDSTAGDLDWVLSHFLMSIFVTFH